MEGLFLHQMLKAMDQETWGEGLFSGSSAGRVFRARRNEKLAEELGRREALGLSEVLYRELAEQVAGTGRAEKQESE
jgi:Rod binding domain-containing protein